MFEKIGAWLSHLLRRPGESEEELNLKTTLAIFSFGIVPPVAGLTFLCFWLNLPVLKAYGLALLTYYAVSTLLLVRIKSHVKWFFYASQLSALLITMVTVARLGGILHAGGLLFAALASVVFSMAYPNIRLALMTFSGYVIGVAALAVAQPWLTVAPEMLQPHINLVFTAINSIWIAVFILMVIFAVFSQRAREEQAKTQQLRTLDELKTRLYTNITHEFRTPLTIILGAADAASTAHSLQTLPVEGKGGRFDLIRRNANRLLRLVNQMLNLARLESGGMPVHKIQGDILPVLRYFVDSFHSMAARKMVRLHFLSSLSELIMDYDPDKMEDIISNLLSNAIKFTPPDGDIYLTADVQEKNGDGLQLLLKVRDTGIGIPSDQLELIFERFFQVESGNEPIEEGSGIGLTLVKEYVRLLGGTILVQSKPGKGTEFTVLLPISQEAAHAEAPPGVQQQAMQLPEAEADEMNFSYPSAPSDEKQELPVLLLVEDNTELRHYLQTLTAPYYQIQMARNGQEGIERALELVPDIIVSDVMMPVKDGFELCRVLKNDFRTSHIPVILLTARADAMSKLAGLEKGADAYMPKPFQPKELLLRLRKLLELREKLKIKYSLTPFGAAATSSRAVGLDEIFLRDTYRILEDNYQKDEFGIEDLCAALHISRVQLHRKLIALRGQSASHFINHFRIEKAGHLLKNTRKTIAEIAYEVGFHDANYFTKVFTKIYKMPPGDWRQNL